MISFEDFKKLDLKIGKVIIVEKIENTDKLLKLIVDIGGEKRQIVSGIAQDYSPEELINKEIVVLVNLEPKKFRGIESQGMLLAADLGGKAIILIPEKEVPPGTKVC